MIIHSQLDYIFPFVVFFYGTIMLFVLENPYFIRIGEQRMAPLYTQMTKHRPLAWICFFIGGLWSAQNLFFQT